MAVVRPDSPGLVVRLAANSLVQIGGTGLASAISFFTFVAITRGLGPSAYGSFVAATAFLYLPSVLADLGLSTVVLREISARPEETEPTMRRALPARTLISAVAIAVAVVVGLLLPFDHQTKTGIAVLSLWAFAALLNSSLLPVLQAQLRMQWAVLANVVGRLVTLVLTLAVLGAGLGFDAVVWATVVGTVVTLAVDFGVVARSISLRPVLDFDYWGSLVRTSLVLGLAVGLGQVFFRIDGVLLMLFQSASEVGLYGAAFKFIELSELIVVAVGVSVLPVLTRMAADAETERIGRAVQRTFDVLVATAIPLCIVLFAFPEELLHLTSGAEFEAGSPALRILAFYPLLAFVAGLFWQVAIAAGLDRRLLASAVGVLLLNVVLNLALLGPYGYKAAASTKLACEVVSVAVVAYLVHRAGIALPRFGYAPVIAAGGLTMAAVIVLLPGPAALVGACALTAYAAVVTLAPGTVRAIARDVLRAVRRRPAPTT